MKNPDRKIFASVTGIYLVQIHLPDDRVPRADVIKREWTAYHRGFHPPVARLVVFAATKQGHYTQIMLSETRPSQSNGKSDVETYIASKLKIPCGTAEEKAAASKIIEIRAEWHIAAMINGRDDIRLDRSGSSSPVSRHKHDHTDIDIIPGVG